MYALSAKNRYLEFRRNKSDAASVLSPSEDDSDSGSNSEQPMAVANPLVITKPEPGKVAQKVEPKTIPANHEAPPANKKTRKRGSKGTAKRQKYELKQAKLKAAAARENMGLVPLEQRPVVLKSKADVRGLFLFLRYF